MPPAHRDPAIELPPIEKLNSPPPAGTGRPRKHPPMPDLELEEAEHVLFEGFMEDFLGAYPDLTNADYRMLWMAGTRYIAGLRLIKHEMLTGRTITMSRQHPLVEMRALLDQLSVTRKARTHGEKPEHEDEAAFRELLMGLGSQPLPLKGSAKQPGRG